MSIPRLGAHVARGPRASGPRMAPAFRIAHNSPTHFHIEQGGTSFKVAKAGLSGAMREKIQRLAQGGEVEPSESMEAVEKENAPAAGFALIKTHAKHHEVRFPSGNVGKIARSRETDARIQKLCGGGTVEGYAEGGPVQSEPSPYDIPPAETSEQPPQPPESSPYDIPPAETSDQPTNQTRGAPSGLDEIRPRYESYVAHMAPGVTPFSLSEFAQMEANAPAEREAQQAAADQDQYTPTVAAARAQEREQAAAQGPVSSGGEAATAAAPTEPADDTLPPGSFTGTRPTGAAAAQGRASSGAGAPSRTAGRPRLAPARAPALDPVTVATKAATDADAAFTAAQKDFQSAKDGELKDALQRREELRKQTEQARADYMTGKVDPFRIWSSAPIGAKVAGAIGMLLSGIGSGMSGQPNYALAMLNKAVDDDIDAQKSELGQKKNNISMLMEQGHDMDSAIAQTRADLQNALASQIQLAQYRHGNQQSVVAAIQAQQHYNQAATEHHDEMALKWSAQKNAGALNDAHRRLLEAEAGKNDAQANLFKTKSGQVQSGAVSAEDAAFSTIPPDKLLEHRVTITHEEPTGAVDSVTKQPVMRPVRTEWLDYSPGRAAKSQEEANALQDQQLRLNRIRAFQADHPYGTLNPAERQRARTLLVGLWEAIPKTAADVNRFTGEERELSEVAAMDPSKITDATLGRVLGSIDGLQSGIDDRRQTLVSHLHRWQ